MGVGDVDCGMTNEMFDLHVLKVANAKRTIKMSVNLLFSQPTT
jgi:hypothetical protein